MVFLFLLAKCYELKKSVKKSEKSQYTDKMADITQDIANRCKTTQYIKMIFSIGKHEFYQRQNYEMSQQKVEENILLI